MSVPPHRLVKIFVIVRLDFDDETVSVGSDEINLFVFLDEMIVVEVNECDLA